MLPIPTNIKGFLKAGTTFSSIPDNVKYVLRTNFITLTIQVLIIPFSVLFYFLSTPLHAVLLMVAFFLFFPIYALNSRGLQTVAKGWLLFMVLVCLYFFGASFGQESSVHYLFFVFITLPFLLFKLKQRTHIVVSITVFFFAFYAMEFNWLPLPVVMSPSAQYIMHIAMLTLVLVWLTVNFLYFELTNKLTEDTLRANNAKLQTKNTELEQFAYIASHDLQEPLLTVSSFSALLEEDFAHTLEDDAKLYLKYINLSSIQMSLLVKGLMEYGRIGKSSELTKINCRNTIADAVNTLSTNIKNSSAKIEYNNLPKINGYEDELRILFQNLIGNAIKFCRPDVAPYINISAAHINDSWLFSVADNGIGIEEKYNEKIFNIFQRLHKRSEYDGTGIGLAYCRKIVELHGGKIWVHSTPGSGSTFCFTIPDL